MPSDVKMLRWIRAEQRRYIVKVTGGKSTGLATTDTLSLSHNAVQQRRGDGELNVFLGEKRKWVGGVRVISLPALLLIISFPSPPSLFSQALASSFRHVLRHISVLAFPPVACSV